MDSICTCEDTCLLSCSGHTVDLSDLGSSLLILFDSLAALVCRKLVAKLRLRCDNNICNTHERIYTSGKDLKLHVSAVFVLKALSVLFDVESYLRTLGSSNPVCLQLLCLLRPVELRQIVEELLCVVSDLEKPLCHVLVLYLRVATLALAVYNLLVCKNCLTGRTPVYRCVLSVCEASLVQFQEEPLVPLVVLRLACLYLI